MFYSLPHTTPPPCSAPSVVEMAARTLDAAAADPEGVERLAFTLTFPLLAQRSYGNEHRLGGGSSGLSCPPPSFLSLKSPNP